MRLLCLALLIAAPSQLWGADDVAPPQQLTNSLDMKLVRIGPGEFLMGVGEGPPKTREEWAVRDEDESPAHRVKIPATFWMGVHEVTNAQYERFDPQHKELRGKFGGTQADDEPVTQVNWQQAAEFCQWLSKQEGKPYRLPTEAEWEYACRAGTTTSYSTGDVLGKEQANFGLSKTEDAKKITAQKVGSYPANAWGLCDMHGNVAEWCHDWYGPYEAGEQTAPVGRADGHARVIRGWSYDPAGFQNSARFCRSANRSGHLPEDANRYTGFRVVQGELPATKPLPVAAPPLHQQNVKQTPASKAGPDAAKPYFVNFAEKDAAGQSRNPTIPPSTFGPIFSQHNHFSAVTVCPNGDVLAVWYTCVGEADRQLAQAASRLRAGSDRWEPASLFFGVPDVNCHAPVLLTDGGRIYHFCTQSLHGWDYATDVVRHSDDNGAIWSKPRAMVTRDDQDRLSQPCSAIVAADGTILLACDGDNHKDERIIRSRDRGQTWQVAAGDMRKDAGGKYVIHPAIFQRKDGSILSYLRGPDPMPVLVSQDAGDSWQAEQSPFGGIGGGQKTAVLRLASGAVLLLTADTKKWFGGGTLVALSLDDGRTWPHARKVDAPVGGYMSLAQAPNGTIYLIGSRLQFAACNEAWLKEGKPLEAVKGK